MDGTTQKYRWHKTLSLPASFSLVSLLLSHTTLSPCLHRSTNPTATWPDLIQFHRVHVKMSSPLAFLCSDVEWRLVHANEFPHISLLWRRFSPRPPAPLPPLSTYCYPIRGFLSVMAPARGHWTRGLFLSHKVSESQPDYPRFTAAWNPRHFFFFRHSMFRCLRSVLNPNPLE